MKKINNHKNIILSVLGIGALLLVVGVGVSFAFLANTKNNTSTNAVTAESIIFSYSNLTANGNEINLTNEMPMNDAEGKLLIKSNNNFNFTILANTLKAAVNYEIVVQKQSNSTLKDSQVKIYLTDTTSTEIAIGKTVTNKGVTRYSELIDTNFKKKTGKSIYEEKINKGNKFYQKNFRVRMWIADDQDMVGLEDHNKVFKIKVKVYANVGVKEQTKNLLGDELVRNLGDRAMVYDDPITNVKFIRNIRNIAQDPGYNLVNNFVWWSGMMWRIYAINPDGSMKAITDDNVGIATMHNNSAAYATSYTKQWLEAYFYPKLNSSKDIVLKQANDFCIDKNERESSALPRVACTNKLSNLKVGLLTVDEYGIVQDGMLLSYLVNNNNFWTMTTNRDSTRTNVVYNSSNVFDNSSVVANGIRPVVVFNSASTISSGSGSLESPYKLKQDVEKAKFASNLNTRYSGEFITYDNKLWRIMEVKNGLTKVIYDGATKLIPDAAFGKDNLDWGTMKIKLDGIGISTAKIAQNQTWQRGYFDYGNNVLTTSLGEGNPVISTFGLPKIGEMWASHNNRHTNNYQKFSDEHYWTMTPHLRYPLTEWSVCNGSPCYILDDSSGGVEFNLVIRPTFFFEKDVTISDGDGTLNAPYKLS